MSVIGTIRDSGNVRTVLLFLISFLLPVLILFAYLQWRGSGGAAVTPTTSLSSDGKQPVDEIFPEAFPVVRAESLIEIPNSELLHPQENSDFMIVLAINLRRLPRAGSRMIVASKFSSYSPAKEGYAIAFSRFRSTIRPEVYWKNKSGKGKWYTFSEIAVTPGEWVTLAVTHYDNQFLGVHSSMLIDRERNIGIKLAGGYDFGEPIIPRNEEPLVIGAVERNKFRGKVGALGLIRGVDLEKRVEETLQSVHERLEAGNPQEDDSLWIFDLNRFATDGRVEKKGKGNQKKKRKE